MSKPFIKWAGGTLTPLQRAERAAMCGDRAAVLQVVSALRQYRAVAADAISRMYTGGTLDRVDSQDIQDRWAEIELLGQEGEDE